ncbi:hypothetical protein [Roseimaritima ulvae]|uniref:Uncharacterized protein n=1 Tax=Roseimaritima ulvae TaxID=980254 RepID=A0A5B9R4P2_9BACT|nr:hypothetical protein [Roseimaritima ulvae]QEG41193.1 hypothetical protein UC8_32120 [Roseimaritima ulvae]
MSQMPPNPYQSQPLPPGALPPAEVKPTSITVFGILNIILGLLGLCGLAAAFAAFFIPTPPGNELPATQLMQNDAYRIFMYITIPLGFIATVALIAGGIGLLQGKGWGRTLSIGYAVYSIISGFLGLIVNVFLIMLPTLRMLPELDPGPEKAGAIGGMVGGTFGGCIGMIFPILLLYFMMRPNVKAYFQESKRGQAS